MTARWARTARGWSIALLTGVLSAALHASAGGGFPAPAIVLLAVLLSGLVSTALIGGAPSLLRLAATVAAGQVTFHAVFTTLGDARGVTLAVSPHEGHGAPGALVAHAGAHAGPEHEGAGMLLAHAVAGLISALLLAHGERAIAAVKRAAVFTLARLTAGPLHLALPRLRPAGIDRALAVPRTPTILGTLRYRGPPALLRAV